MRKIDLGRLMVTIACSFLLTVTPPPPAHADMDMETEIEHLLCHIETSGCTFNRNGTLHTSEEAGEHIRKKYAYVARRIKTTEDFIRYAATKSSISGTPYLVSCKGIEMPTATWLEEELLRFRGDNLMMPKPG